RGEHHPRGSRVRVFPRGTHDVPVALRSPSFSSEFFNMTSIASRARRALLVTMAAGLLCAPAAADPWLRPGDTALRSDLYTLADAGVLRAPLTAWPLPWADIVEDLDAVRADDLDAGTRTA